MTLTVIPSQPHTKLLVDYDSTAYGPLFAVSDEGSAGSVVVSAAYKSAKAGAYPSLVADPLSLGVILDGERMTSAGEVPIGPPEYAALSAAASGRLLLTTNVGVRVNVRLTGQLPEFTADPDSIDDVVAAFQPFLHTPDGQPRPLTVRLCVQGTDFTPLATLAARVQAAREAGQIGPASMHRLSVLVAFDDEITDSQLTRIEEVIAAAANLRIAEVAIDGEERVYARQRWGGQGLLNVLDIEHLSRLLPLATGLGVRLVPRYQLDADSAARTVWTGLEAARTNGFDAGKYGLLPLTLEEQVPVIESVTRWTTGWTAIPAFYVDTPLVTATKVFDVNQCEEAARLWLKAARGAGATIALFDAPDRVTPRKLVKSADSPEGVLTVDQIGALVEYGNLLGVKILWSGGITAPQAFELSQRGVCGIFSTSSTASKEAVTADFDDDPRLPAENEPTELGVRRMHAIIQGGFLTSRLRSSHPDVANAVHGATENLVTVNDTTRLQTALQTLNPLLLEGWQALSHAVSNTVQPQVFSSDDPPQPVPADAVRVFRGRMLATTARHQFVQRLGQVFMPTTVQLQRLYGLTAYLPAVPPMSKNPTLPDEIALVFYRTQQRYIDAKRCVGGRSYKDLHEVAFDMPLSGSDFPKLLSDNTIAPDQPYHLFEKSVDWQSGGVRLFLGIRKQHIAPSAFLAGVAQSARKVQTNPRSLDAAIFVASGDWIAWWDHASTQTDDPVTSFEDIADTHWTISPRQIRIPTDLTTPYSGLSLSDTGDFVNFQFSRLS